MPVFETGVSRATADRFGLALDEVVSLLGDPGDPLLGRTPQDVYAFARITGIYEVPDEASDFWLDDPLAIHPVIRALSSEVQLLDAALVVDPAAHGAADRVLRASWAGRCATRGATSSTTARSPRAPSRGSITAFRRLEVQYPSANVTAGGNTAMRTGMLAILEGFDAEWAAAESILAVMAVGPALVAVATLALIAILAARRRRATMALARSRGASGAQVLVPDARRGRSWSRSRRPLLAAVAAILLVDGGRAWPSVAMAAAVVAIAVAILVGDGGPDGPRARPGATAGRRTRRAASAGGAWSSRGSSSPWPPAPRIC